MGGASLGNHLQSLQRLDGRKAYSKRGIETTQSGVAMTFSAYLVVLSLVQQSFPSLVFGATMFALAGALNLRRHD
jgi:hypothetical protein